MTGLATTSCFFFSPLPSPQFRKTFFEALTRWFLGRVHVDVYRKKVIGVSCRTGSQECGPTGRGFTRGMADALHCIQWKCQCQYNSQLYFWIGNNRKKSYHFLFCALRFPHSSHTFRDGEGGFKAGVKLQLKEKKEKERRDAGVEAPSAVFVCFV